MSEVVSANEAAHRFGLSEKTVRRWIAAGRLKADKHGRAYGVSLSEVAALIGQAGGHDRGRSTDNGRVSAGASAPHTADATSAMSALPELVALVERLHDEVRQYAAGAAMWQTRAEVLAHQLAEAQGRILALEAPKEPEPAPVPEPLMPALDGELTSRCESVFPTGSAAPWWRRWWGWLAE